MAPVGLAGAWLGFFIGLEIERRPRGASRGKPAPTFVATRRSSQAMVVRLGAWLKTGGAPAAPTKKSRRANKAGNYGLSGHGTLQQMWERACPAKRRAGGARSQGR